MIDHLNKLAEAIIANPNSLPAEAVSFVIDNHGKIARRSYNGYQLSQQHACLMILTYAAKNNPSIRRKFEIATAHLDSGDDLRTEVFVFLQGLPGSGCKYGQIRHIGKGLDTAFAFCGTNGACRCQAEAFVDGAQTKSDTEKATTLARRKQTNQKRFGVDNAMQNPAVAEAFKASVGAHTDQQVKQIVERRNATNMIRRGVDNPFQDKAVRDKIKATNLAKYGVENPAQNASIRSKASATHRERTGYDSPLDLPAVKAKALNSQRENREALNRKIRDTIMANHGVEYAFQLVPRSTHQRKHFSQLAIDVLLNPDVLLDYMATRSIKQAADELGVWIGTVIRYCKQAGMVFERNRSTYEREIEAFLIENGVSGFVKNTRHVIKPLELDFFLPQLNLAIEFNGLFYHSDAPGWGQTDRNAHQIKHNRCVEQGIRLVSINEDEWNERKGIVKARLLNILGKSVRGKGARQLQIRQISATLAVRFCETHHIQGQPYNTIYAAGAFDGDRLVGVVTFNRQRGTNAVQLSRFCTDGQIYAGLFSRLFKHAVCSQGYTRVVTFADKRYSEGNMYARSGFRHDGDTGVDYRYLRGTRTFHKQYLTKANIKKRFGLDITGRTESEMAAELGFHRIYDCGRMRFVWPFDAPAGDPTEGKIYREMRKHGMAGRQK